MENHSLKNLEHAIDNGTNKKECNISEKEKSLDLLILLENLNESLFSPDTKDFFYEFGIFIENNMYGEAPEVLNTKTIENHDKYADTRFKPR
jgi:hypothetical protein